MGGGVSTSRDAREITSHVIVVSRNPAGVLGVGLNEQNMVTVPGPGGTLAGLRVWDKVIMIDGIACGNNTLVATMSGMTPKPMHTLTVLPKAVLASHPAPPAEALNAVAPSLPMPASTESPSKKPNGIATMMNAASGKLSARVSAAPAAAPASVSAAAQTTESFAKSDIVAAMNAAANKLTARVSRAPQKHSSKLAAPENAVTDENAPQESAAEQSAPAPRTPLFPLMPFARQIAPLAPRAPLPPIVAAA